MNSSQPYSYTGPQIRTLMRRHRVTIRGLALQHGITQKRVREVRAKGVKGFAANEWNWFITGAWLDESPAVARSAAPEDGPVIHAPAGPVMQRNSKPSFSFISRFRGVECYQAVINGVPHRLTHYVSAVPFNEVAFYNGTEAEYIRDVIAAIGLVAQQGAQIAPATVNAFNEYLQVSHEADMALVRVYSKGEPSVDCTPPAMARGGKYVVGQGWEIIEGCILVEDIAELCA